MKKNVYLAVNSILGDGSCSGIILDENAEVIGSHYSSDLHFLKKDLLKKIDEKEVNIVNLIGTKSLDEFDLPVAIRNLFNID